jgi:excisionase family DNA binding protein
MAGKTRQKISPDLHLETALRKRERGVPTYTVAEAAALLNVSAMTLYRMISVDAFPAIRMGVNRGAGRWIIPARAIEQLLSLATERGGMVDPTELMNGSNDHGIPARMADHRSRDER